MGPLANPNPSPIHNMLMSPSTSAARETDTVSMNSNPSQMSHNPNPNPTPTPNPNPNPNPNPSLAAWHDEMALRTQARTSRSLTIQSHETFYYCMQAVFYTYCFLGTDLITAVHYNPRFTHVLPHLERCVACSLEPLRFCLHSVRCEFLRLVAHVGLISQACLGSVAQDLLPADDETLPSPNPTPTPTPAATSNGHRIGGPPPLRVLLGAGLGAGARRGRPVRSLSAGLNPLETFFPFDPLLLRRMHPRVAPSYRPWTGALYPHPNPNPNPYPYPYPSL